MHNFVLQHWICKNSPILCRNSEICTICAHFRVATLKSAQFCVAILRTAQFMHNFVSSQRCAAPLWMTLWLWQTQNANYVWNALRSKNVTFKFERRWKYPFYKFGSCKKIAQFCAASKFELKDIFKHLILVLFGYSGRATF